MSGCVIRTGFLLRMSPTRQSHRAAGQGEGTEFRFLLHWPLNGRKAPLENYDARKKFSPGRAGAAISAVGGDRQ